MNSADRHAMITHQRRTIAILKEEAEELRKKGEPELAAISDRRRERVEEKLAELEKQK